jgi:MFS family permease
MTSIPPSTPGDHGPPDASGPGAPATARWPRRTGFALVLALAMGTGTFPGFAFGVLGPDLIAEFALTRTRLGLLTTVFFGVGGLGSIVAGGVVDRFGARRTMVAAFAVMAGALVAMAAAGGLGALLVASAAAGVSLAAGNPTTNKAVAEHLPVGRRGLTMGVKQAGVQFGAVLAGSVVAPLAAVQGWRLALAASAVVPAVGIALTYAVVPPDRATLAASPRAPRTPLPGPVRELAVYAFLMGAAVGAFNAYLPLYGVEQVGLETTGAGAVAAAVGVVGVVSRIAWGWASEHLRSFRRPLLVMGIGGAIAIGILAIAPAGGPWLLWLGGLAFGATAITWNAVGMLAIVARVDSADAGRASGLVLFGFYTGFVPSPVAFGALVDATDSYALSWGVVAGLLTVAGWWARRAA